MYSVLFLMGVLKASEISCAVAIFFLLPAIIPFNSPCLLSLPACLASPRAASAFLFSFEAEMKEDCPSHLIWSVHKSRLEADSCVGHISFIWERIYLSRRFGCARVCSAGIRARRMWSALCWVPFTCRESTSTCPRTLVVGMPSSAVFYTSCRVKISQIINAKQS